MESSDYQVGIIGGGIVGLATALALIERKASLVVLEAEPKLALHQSGRNSGVIHSGLYYRPGSAKANLCTAGRRQLYRFCDRHGIPYRRSGKLVIATAQSELAALDELQRRAHANGLEGVQRLSRDEIHQREPYAAGIAGLWVPQTGVVDFARVTRVLADLFRERGGALQLRTRVGRIQSRSAGFLLETPGGTVRCSYLVNCAGLYSDRIARRCGLKLETRLVPFRGEYFELAPERAHLVRSMIYPVPDPALPFLGVHLTRGIDRCVLAGPNAVLALSREGYRRASFSLRDTLETLAFPGFWRLARQFWHTGVDEIRRSLSRATFLQSLRRLVPEISSDDLRPSRSGVRAQAVHRSGKLLDDFEIVTGERMVHLLNAPSPAATAALAIGRHVASVAAKAFDQAS